MAAKILLPRAPPQRNPAALLVIMVPRTAPTRFLVSAHAFAIMCSLSGLTIDDFACKPSGLCRVVDTGVYNTHIRSYAIASLTTKCNLKLRTSPWMTCNYNALFACIGTVVIAITTDVTRLCLHAYANAGPSP